jgi:hypothetical protein
MRKLAAALLGGPEPSWEAAWLLEALRREPGQAFAALALGDGLISNGHAQEAAELLEAALRYRARQRGPNPWRKLLAEAGPEAVGRTLAEEGRLRHLRAQAMENAFYRNRPNVVQPLTPAESLQVAKIHRAYEDTQLWEPVL